MLRYEYISVPLDDDFDTHLWHVRDELREEIGRYVFVVNFHGNH